MVGWENLIFTTIISLASAAISSLITSQLTFRDAKKKLIHEKRTEEYIALYDQIDAITADKELIFSEDYLNVLVEIKPKLQLLGSKKTFESFHDYFRFVVKQKKEFEDYCDSNNPQYDQRRCEIITDENSIEHEDWKISPQELADFELLKQSYKRDHRPTADRINCYLIPLYEAMRSDLGSNL